MFDFADHPTQKLFSFLELAFPIGFKVLMAIVCGGLIGLERELKNKSAGVKTNILICLGSALYTIISVLLAQSFTEASGYHGDPTRVAAQVVSGIGFLGAGAIMQSKASIHGLTTAATIWIVAAIGLCIGSGYPLVAFVFTMTVLFTLLAVDRFENKYISRSAKHAIEVIFEDAEGKVRAAIDAVLASNSINLDDFDISKNHDVFILHLNYNNTNTVHKKFILDLWSIKGIREVHQL